MYVSTTVLLYKVVIQRVPGGKVNILGGHGIGHSKQKCLYEHVSYSERLVLVFIIDSIVRTLAKVRVRYTTNDGFISDKRKSFVSSLKHPDRPWNPVNLLFKKHRGIFPRGEEAAA